MASWLQSTICLLAVREKNAGNSFLTATISSLVGFSYVAVLVFRATTSRSIRELREKFEPFILKNSASPLKPQRVHHGRPFSTWHATTS